MLLTSFSFICVLQILIGYSNFLGNVELGILFFSIRYFCKCLMPSFVFFLIIDSKAKYPNYKLLSVSNSSTMSLIFDDAIITVVNRFIHNTGRAATFTHVKGTVSCICNKHLQN